MDFTDRTMLVTGAAMGIGAATAKRLARDGAMVIIADLDEQAGEATRQEIADAGGAALFIQVDLSEQASIERMGEQVSGQVRKLHGLVNSAGIVRRAMIADTSETDWTSQMALNLQAPALCTKTLLPLLRKGPGHIVNISSEGAYRPRKAHWVYDATKAGIGALTRNMASEFVEYGMRVNTVAPGWTVTEMHFKGAADPKGRKTQLEQMDMDGAIIRRLARPEEIAAAIAFLLSDEASYITATTLHVDGGRVAH